MVTFTAPNAHISSRELLNTFLSTNQVGRYANSEEASFLIRAGLANATLPAVAEKHGFGPCLRIPSLSAAHEAAVAFVAELSADTRLRLTSPRHRRKRQRN